MGFFKFGRVIERTLQITSSAGSSTLVNSSEQDIELTGTTTHTIVLPDATTCPNGTVFKIKNDSTGLLTIEYDDNTTLTTITAGASKEFILFDNSTSNGLWSALSGAPASSDLKLKIKARTATPQTATTGTDLTIIFDSEIQDDQNAYDNTTGEFTVPTGFAGFYIISANVDLNNTSGTGQRNLKIFVNGSNVEQPDYLGDPSGNNISTLVFRTGAVGLQLADGDVVKIVFNQNSGGNLTVGNSGTTFNQLTIFRYSN